MVMVDSAGGHTDASKSKPSNAEVRSNWQAERAGREAEARGWKPTGPRRGERLGSRQPSQRAAHSQLSEHFGLRDNVVINIFCFRSSSFNGKPFTFVFS